MLFLWALAFILVLQERDLLGNGQNYTSLACNLWLAKSSFNNRIQLVLAFTQTFHPALRSSHLQLAAADPVSMLPGNLGRGSWCNEHDAIHERLDIIEEKVIKTVEHLESEVKSLLDIISETTSNIPITPGTPLIDIFDDTS